ncbi:hypothetical protein C9439_05180 [archaeon SCG-AAA382B04]|nr:hypothetical protein C9439_05180 [archaeon SCG-AAA382B04]
MTKKDEKKQEEQKPKNKVFRTEEGIDILKEPENVEEEVLNAIFLSEKKDIEEVDKEEIDQLIEEYKQKLEQKEENND